MITRKNNTFDCVQLPHYCELIFIFLAEERSFYTLVDVYTYIRILSKEGDILFFFRWNPSCVTDDLGNRIKLEMKETGSTFHNIYIYI